MGWIRPAHWSYNTSKKDSLKPTDVEATANYYLWAQVLRTVESGMFRHGANKKRIADVCLTVRAEMIRHTEQINKTEGHGE